MIRKAIAFPSGAPLSRASAAQLVLITGRYESRVMIEHAQKLVNAKSMLGLLSLGLDDQADLTLLAEGPDEQQAVDAVLSWLNA